MKKLLKGLLLSTMSVIMCTAMLTGCKKDDRIQIGIIQMSENGSFAEMREAFIAEMATLGYDDSKVNITFENAKGEMSELTTAITKTVNNCDIIMPMTTTPAVQTYSYLTSQGIEKPMIFMSVTDPVASGLMTTLENPDKNCTGSSNVVPVSEILKFVENIKPVTKYGIIYDNSNTAATNTANKAISYLNDNNISHIEETASTASNIDMAISSLLSKNIDALYIPLDSTMQDYITNIIAATNAKKIPVYGSADIMVAKGALGTVGVSYTKIGQLTAKMVVDYIQGKKISEIPAEVLNEYVPAINLTTASTIGIEIPESVLSMTNIVKFGTAA